MGKNRVKLAPMGKSPPLAVTECTLQTKSINSVGRVISYKLKKVGLELIRKEYAKSKLLLHLIVNGASPIPDRIPI